MNRVTGFEIKCNSCLDYFQPEDIYKTCPKCKRNYCKECMGDGDFVQIFKYKKSEFCTNCWKQPKLFKCPLKNEHKCGSGNCKKFSEILEYQPYRYRNDTELYRGLCCITRNLCNKCNACALI